MARRKSTAKALSDRQKNIMGKRITEGTIKKIPTKVKQKSEQKAEPQCEGNQEDNLAQVDKSTEQRD